MAGIYLIVNCAKEEVASTASIHMVSSVYLILEDDNLSFFWKVGAFTYLSEIFRTAVHF
jgi:hypothetical protein